VGHLGPARAALSCCRFLEPGLVCGSGGATGYGCFGSCWCSWWSHACRTGQQSSSLLVFPSRAVRAQAQAQRESELRAVQSLSRDRLYSLLLHSERALARVYARHCLLELLRPAAPATGAAAEDAVAAAAAAASTAVGALPCGFIQCLGCESLCLTQASLSKLLSSLSSAKDGPFLPRILRLVHSSGSSLSDRQGGNA
jgi:hypothetical protein